MYFTTIVSGSSGNCILVSSGNTTLLVDGGCSVKALKAGIQELAIPPQSIKGMLITHEHADHVSGAARICRAFDIPLYASEKTWEALPFRDEYFTAERHKFAYGMTIGDLSIDFFRLSHDSVQPVGFVFSHGGKRVGIATDTGMVTQSMLRLLQNVHGLVLEANHDADMLRRGPYPFPLKQRVISQQGHLSNDQAANLLLTISGENTRQVLLAHLSAVNNRPDLARTAVEQAIKGSPYHDHLSIHIAPRKKPHPLLEV